MIDLKILVKENRQCLRQAIDLLEKISDKLYSNNGGPFFTSGVGKHIRHVIDFYDNLLSGRETKVDYDARNRDEKLERDRGYGIKKIGEVMDLLSRLPVSASETKRLLPVKNDEVGSGNSEALYCHSTLERELQFLKFHAVHHYAMIAMILRVQGFEPPEDFGFAPSTLHYLNKR